MSERVHSRRETLRTAALGAGAIAATGLLRPTLAAAQSAGDEDLRDFLAEAIALEQITVLAYAQFADSSTVNSRIATTLTRFRDQEQAHANALRTALDNLGFDLPDAPDAPDDTGVLDVDGIDEEAAGRLTDLLEGIERPESVDEVLEYLVRLEREQLDYYLGEAPGLDSWDLSTTGAEIAGCQAQHLVVLGVELGSTPAVAAAGVTKSTDGG